MPVYKGNPTKDGRMYYFRNRKKNFKGELEEITSKKFKTRKEAQDEERLFMLKKNNPYRKKFQDVAMSYFEEAYKKRKESTIFSYEMNYNKNIKPYFEQKDINDINNQDILNWHDIVAKNGFKIRYMQNLHMILSEILNHAVKYYGLENNVAKIVGNFEKKNDEVEIKKKMDYLNYEDYLELLSVVDNEEDKSLYQFLFYTGCRIGEVQALHWGDIDFINNKILINKTLSTKTKDKEFKITTTKNGKNRIIIMNDKLKEVLVNHYNNMKKYENFEEDWYVFGNSRFMPETTIRRKLKKYFSIISPDGKKRISPHGFRHTLVTLLANKYIEECRKKDVKIDTEKFFLQISSRTGHDIATMRRTYMHLFPTVQDELCDLLDSF